jgi:TIGR03009 family protein
MRRSGLILTGIGVSAFSVWAQQTTPPKAGSPLQPIGGFGGQTQTQTPTQPSGGVQPGGAAPVAVPTPVPPDATTLQHLTNWEAAMKEVKTFYAAATMVDKDVPKKREARFTAQMWLMKPNLARMDQVKELPKGQQPTLADQKMYISTGRTLYLYDGFEKKRTQAALGPGGAGNNLLLDIMAGMSVKQVTDRFTVKTIKQDENFVYLEVKPVYRVDKEEFDSLTLVLCGAKYQDRAYIPRMIVLNKAGGEQTETWDFPDPKVNPNGITADTFTPPKPDGLKEEVLELPRISSGPGASRVPTPGVGK